MLRLPPRVARSILSPKTCVRRQQAHLLNESMDRYLICYQQKSLINTNSANDMNSLEHRSATNHSSLTNQRPLYAKNQEHHESIATSTNTSAIPPMDDIDSHTISPLLPRTQLEAQEQQLQAQIANHERPNIHDFLAVLKTLSSNSKQGGVARRAEYWMSRLEEVYGINQQGNQNDNSSETIENDFEINRMIGPIMECYLCTIDAWAFSIADDPVVLVNRAGRWLESAKMVAARAPPLQVQHPLTLCYNSYLAACSKGRQSKLDRKATEHHAQRAEEILQEMMQQYKSLGGRKSRVLPNTDSVNYVMRAIIRRKNYPDKIAKTREYLEFMERSVEQNARHGKHQHHNNNNNKSLMIPPNAASYNLCLSAMASVAIMKARRCRDKEPSNKGDKQLDDGMKEMADLHDAVDHMRQLFEKGRMGVIENNVPYNTVLSAWSRIAGLNHRYDAQMQAEKVFSVMVAMSGKDGNMPEVAPDAVSYLQVIRAWASSESERAGEKVNWWLEKQWEEFDKSQNVDLMPTTRTYNEAIVAWSRAGNPEKAEDLLLDLVRRQEVLKSNELEPNTETYASIIRSWLNAAESKEERSLDKRVASLTRAADWLESLSRQESDDGPTSSHDLFLRTLKAARTCAKDRPDVLDLAKSAFDTLRNSRHFVDASAYTYLLQVGLLALSKKEHDGERTKFVTDLVYDCCDDGLVTKSFVRNLTNSPVYQSGWTTYESSRLSSTLFPNWPLPSNWTRNVSGAERLPRAEDFQRKFFKLQDEI